MLREAIPRLERPAPGFPPARSRVLDQETAVAEPADAPGPAPEPVDEPAPVPAPTPAQPAGAATATVPTHIRGATSPAGTPDRIPPRVDTEVAVAVAGASESSPVTLSVEGAGGGNGTATVDGAATAALAAGATVKLRGGDQTEDGKAGNLRLVASQGGNRLAASAGFSVAAWPVTVGMRFFSLMQPATIDGVTVWGARYDLTVASDSGVRGDLDRTKISESVLVHSATGLFRGAANRHSGFKPATARQRDNHGTGSADGTAAGLIAEIRRAGIARSKQVAHQLFRFSCLRTGIAEDQAAPKVATSGFRIAHRPSAAGADFFMNVKKEGFANNDVAAGPSDDATEKAAKIRD